MIVITEHAEGCILPVRAQPGARRNGVQGEQNGALKVAVTQVAEKGKANKAVLEVLDGSPVSEVAVRYGVSRQSVYSWKARHAAAGLDGLREATRRPRTSPSRLPAEIEALVCELRRAHPRWGARRIAFEVAQRGVAGAPSRASEPRPTQGHLGDPGLPDGGARRSCCALRGLRSCRDRLQLLPQPPLSEVPGTDRASLARAAAG